jgi:hypothetical protein
MGIRNDATDLFFFAYWDRSLATARLVEDPPQRGKTKRLNISLPKIIFLSLLPTGKVVDNQNNNGVVTFLWTWLNFLTRWI